MIAALKEAVPPQDVLVVFMSVFPAFGWVGACHGPKRHLSCGLLARESHSVGLEEPQGLSMAISRPVIASGLSTTCDGDRTVGVEASRACYRQSGGQDGNRGVGAQ
jgi:hypothetical protein